MSTIPTSQPDSATQRSSINFLWSLDRYAWLVLIGLSVVFSLMRWCTLEALWGDSPRWIFEVYRAATGELPYRDFAWQYPPLSLFLFSSAVTLFGHTFPVVQFLLDLLSTTVVLLTWDFARRLLPSPLPLLIAAAFACAGASNSANFALYSLQIYTPAILTGMIGLLLLLRILLDDLQDSAPTYAPLRFGLLSLGAALCLLSKPEFMVGASAALMTLALADLRLRFRHRSRSAWFNHYVKIAVAAFVPAAAGYAVICFFCKPENVVAGVTGYGLAALSCPWWPTGLGLFGALAALSYGVVIAALFSLTRVTEFRQRYGNRYPLLWIAAAISLVIIAFYLPFCTELPMFQGHITPSHTFAYFVSTGTMLLPVMWFCILLFCGLALSLIQALFRSGFRGAHDFGSRQAILFVIFSAAVAMSLRGLFSGTMSQLSLASVAAYPLWFILGPYLLIRFLEQGEGTGNAIQLRLATAPLAVLGLVGTFALVRLAGFVVGEVKRPYAKVVTRSGVIRLKDTSQSPQVYAFMDRNSRAHEPILDLAGGGGINIGQLHPSPVFSTQFTALAPPPRYPALDEQLVEQQPPRLIIANAGVDFQASYGICMNTGCTFPRLVWRSLRPACRAAVPFPMLDYVRQNYTPIASFGDKVIYRRKGR